MITSVVPKLPFIDKEQTIDYYVKQLGFTLKSDYGEYIIMELDKAELHFFSYPGIKPGNSDFMVYLRIDIKNFKTKTLGFIPMASLKLSPGNSRSFL